MKTIASGETIYNMADVARAVGMGYATLWARVKYGLLEPPQVSHGRGTYYGGEAFGRIVARLKAERVGKEVA